MGALLLYKAMVLTAKKRAIGESTAIFVLIVFFSNVNGYITM